MVVHLIDQGPEMATALPDIYVGQELRWHPVRVRSGCRESPLIYSA